MTRVEMLDVMETIFGECRALREAGQKEYAHDDGNAFANFEADAAAFGLSREVALLVFGGKHWRGIQSWARGHRSQREDVRGRINDLIVYLCLLRGMIEEDAKREEASLATKCVCGHDYSHHHETGSRVPCRSCACLTWSAS